MMRYRVTTPWGKLVRIAANTGGIVTEIGPPFQHLWGCAAPLVREHLEEKGCKVERLEDGELFDELEGEGSRYVPWLKVQEAKEGSREE